MSRKRVALGCALAALLTGILVSGLPCWAGPPLLTDDPETPGQHGWEVNVAHTLEKTRQGLGMEVPIFDINYGLLENDQWKIEFPVACYDPESGDEHWGMGDLFLGWKYRFLEEDRLGFMASIYPQLSIPTGNERFELGEGGTGLLLPLEVGKHFCDDQLFVYGEVGYTVGLDKSELDSWRFGLAAEWQATKKLQLLAEVGAYTYPSGDESDNPFFQGGFRYALSERVSLMGAAGRSFRSGASEVPELTSYLGLQFTWGSKKAD